jgi:DNA-binding transcriptional regulator YiaG
VKKRDRGAEKEKNKFSKDLIKSLGEARDHAEGRAGSARVHVAEVPDVWAIRRKLRLSQQEFAPEISHSSAVLSNVDQAFQTKWISDIRCPALVVSRGW